MTIGPENFGNGSSKTEDRFGGQLGGYRSASRRDSGAVLPIDGTGDDLSPRNGSMPSIDRSSERGIDSAPIASSLTAPKLMEPSLGDLGSLGDSMFTSDSWLDGPGGSLADHPLLRGLLLELPPKGSMPHQDWLDRWFEAARSILELLYAHESPGRKGSQRVMVSPRLSVASQLSTRAGASA